MLRCLFYLGVSLLATQVLRAQLPPPVQEYRMDTDSLLRDSLQGAWPMVELPLGFELPALRALSHYPELQGLRIVFRYERNKTAHSSRPRIWSVGRRPHRRCYLIAISTDVPDFFEPGMLKNLPYNAQIGVLGHELAHTCQYLGMRTGALLREGIRYQTRAAHVQTVEHHTDSIAIRHHLGYQLRTWSGQVRPLLR
jgi:hypothetical protein